MTKPIRFNFTGYRTQFPVGVNKDSLAITLTHDDGTSGNWLIMEFNDIPYAAIPITDKQGLDKMIEVLQEMSKNAFKK